MREHGLATKQTEIVLLTRQRIPTQVEIMVRYGAIWAYGYALTASCPGSKFEWQGYEGNFASH